MFKTELEHLNELPLSMMQEEHLFLWIWYVDKIPPHIGCSAGGAYFSLKANGRDLMIPIDKVEKIIKNKSIPFLLIETKHIFSPEEILQTYLVYENASHEGVSCLKPMLDLLQTPPEIIQIKHLIEHLESTEKIKHIFGLNLKPDFSGLPEYGQKEISDRLRKLNHAKRRKSISTSC